MTYFDRPSATSCATCIYWSMASQSPQAISHGIPPEHVYCPILALDMEPFRGRRATMIRCDSHRPRFSE